MPHRMGARQADRSNQRHQARNARRPSRRSVKIHRSYTVDQAARVTGYAKGTIRRWIKSGALPAITDRKTILILGGDLADYLKARSTRGTKLKIDEWYCFKCRAARAPAWGIAEYMPLTSSTGNLRALCCDCTTVMHKAIAQASLAALAGIVDVAPSQGAIAESW